jgi:hypothetical protein
MPNREMTNRNHPSTSREAADKLVSSGKRKKHLDMIQEVLLEAKFPRTVAEIAALAGLKHMQVARRGGDMTKIGVVVGIRKCRILNSNAQTWVAL